LKSEEETNSVSQTKACKQMGNRLQVNGFLVLSFSTWNATRSPVQCCRL